MPTLGMEQLVTAVAIAALLVVVHAVFAVYFYRALSAERETDDSPADAIDQFRSVASDETPRTEPEPEPDLDGAGQSAVVCPTCGAQNDPSFQFCRRCVSQLSGSSVSQSSAANESSG